MKTFTSSRLNLLPAFLLLSTLAFAKPRPAAPAVPGYWNIETNLTTRNYTVVRFYNAQDQLVYEERLAGLCLDLSRNTGLCRRTAKQLNLVLQQVLREPAAPGQATTLLAAQFTQNRRVQRVYAAR